MCHSSCGPLAVLCIATGISWTMVVSAFSSYAFNAASLWSLSGIKLWWIMVSLDDVREGSTFKMMQSTVMSIFYIVYSVCFSFAFFDLLSIFFSFHLFFHHSVLPTLILKWDLSKWNRIRESASSNGPGKLCTLLQSADVKMWRINCERSAFSKFETFVKHKFWEGPVFKISEGCQEWKDK